VHATENTIVGVCVDEQVSLKKCVSGWVSEWESGCVCGHLSL